MNKIFSFERFGKYFVYDLNNARNNYGLSLLLTGIMPIVLYMFFHLYSLVFNQSWGMMGRVPVYVVFFASLLIVTLTAPVKIYGGITDKKMGSDWILIPASVLEKCLSLFIILGIIVPVLFVALFACSDLLLSILDRSYNAALIGNSDLWDSLRSVFDSSSDGTKELSLTRACYLLVWLNWFEGVLLFALGALCFRKTKIVKTVLVCWLASTLLSFILLPVLIHADFDIEGFVNSMTVEKAEFLVNFVLNLFYTVVIGGLMAGIVYRVKTIKQ